jgi:hypothetical protein
MRVKFSLLSIIGLILLSILSGFGAILIIGGLVSFTKPDCDILPTSTTTVPIMIFGMFCLVGGCVAMGQFIIEQVKNNSIVIDLEDLRKEEIRKEMQELFDKFLKENLK